MVLAKFLWEWICLVVLVCIVRSAGAEEEYARNSLVVLDSVKGDYGTVSVIDDLEHKRRLLKVDDSIIGGFWVGFTKPSELMPIHRVFELIGFVRYAKKPLRTVLQIGLGIGSVPMLLQHLVPSIKTVDVVEIDEHVVKYAKKYFHYSTRGGKVFVEDGKEFLFSSRAKKAKYDVVVHDVFSDGPETRHLCQPDVFERVKHVLKNNGMFVYNFLATKHLQGRSKKKFCDLKGVFKHVRCFLDLDSEKEELDAIYNTVCFCSSSKVVFQIPEQEEDSVEPTFYADYYMLPNFQDWQVFDADNVEEGFCESTEDPTHVSDNVEEDDDDLEKAVWENAKTLLDLE